MSKAVVTGGAGFIGSHVVDALLTQGHRVAVIDNLSTGRVDNIEHCLDEIEFIQADLSTSDRWIAALEGADWVVHLAALADIVPSIQLPASYFAANVQGTLAILEASRGAGISRFVYGASSSCYGIPDVYPTPESSDLRPEYPYALTKLMGEQLVLHWAKVYSLPALSLRFFNVYGPRSRTSGTYGAVFGVFLAQKLAGAPLTIVGDGKQTRDFTFVADIAAAVVAALQSRVSGIALNVGSGRSISVNRIAELIGGATVSIPRRPGEPDCTFADITAIDRELGWRPQISIEEGVEQVLANIDYWRDAPVWSPEQIEEATVDWFKYLGQS